MAFDESIFFLQVRPHLGGRLTQEHVDGMGALLDIGAQEKLSLHEMAEVLAQVRIETGGMMYPIKETVLSTHKDKNPSDKEVQDRLERAWNKGQLTWVKTPYWRSGAFGRGYIQLTHWDNYSKFSKVVGVDLLKFPEKALELPIAAQIAVIGMKKGMFTGRKLSDYVFPEALDYEPQKHPRRMVNGVDGTDKLSAAHHRQFASALQTAGWGTTKPSPISLLVQLLQSIFQRGKK